MLEAGALPRTGVIKKKKKTHFLKEYPLSGSTMVYLSIHGMKEVVCSNYELELIGNYE